MGGDGATGPAAGRLTVWSDGGELGDVDEAAALEDRAG